MEKMINEMEKDVGRILVTEEQIKARVAELGEELSREYADKNVILVCILKGAVQFFSDLSRAMTCKLEMDFMSISSYGNNRRTSGIVRIAKDLDSSITGRHVLIAEDIMDSGLTLNHLLTVLRTREPASIKVACLLDKPDRRECDLTPDYVGFVIPNEFVIGYGLDYRGIYRNLPYVGVISESAIKE